MTIHMAETANGWLVSFADEAGMGSEYRSRCGKCSPQNMQIGLCRTTQPTETWLPRSSTRLEAELAS